MIPALYVLFVLNCLFLILVVLLQAGKGDGLAVFGGGPAGGTLLGARGAATFLSKLTVGSAVLFMLLSIILAYYSSASGSRVGRGSVDPNQPQSGMTAPVGEEPGLGDEVPGPIADDEMPEPGPIADDEMPEPGPITDDEMPEPGPIADDEMPEPGPADEAPEPGPADETPEPGPVDETPEPAGVTEGTGS